MPRSRRVHFVIALTAAMFLLTATNWAQNSEVNVQIHGFQDSRGVTVLSPTADLSKDLTERTSLRVSFGLDAISAASDSCARCHRDGINSRRQDGGLSVTRKFNALKWTVGGAYSQENFYRATTALTSLSRDLNNANTTIAAGYAFSLNQPNLHPTVDVENQFQHNAFVSITQTLSKLTVGQASYEVGRMSGYQDNPFLRASVNGVMVLGQVPDLRLRQTVAARLRQALPAETYLQADYRYYSDDWQVRSNTAAVGVTHHFGPAFLAGVEYRRYSQTGASFYQPQYSGALPDYFTADFRLEPFSSNSYVGKITISPPRGFLGFPDGSGLTMQYDRYRTDNGFEAAIVSAGLRVPLGPK